MGTWNIANARGPTNIRLWPFDPRPNLEGIADTIVLSRLDIVGLQEIDTDCRWSERVDEVEFLRQGLERRTGKQWYAARVSNYRFRRIGWPELYPVDTGNAILTRCPMTQATVEGMMWPTLVTDRAILKKRYLHAVLDVHGRAVNVVNVHLDSILRRAFFDIGKECRITAIMNYVRTLDGPLIVLGDFNTVPLYERKRHGFTHGDKDDYRKDKVLQIIKAFGLLQATEVPNPLHGHAEVHGTHLTYPAPDHRNGAVPNRNIDYIFVSRGDFLTGDCNVVFTPASDHGMKMTEVYLLPQRSR